MCSRMYVLILSFLGSLPSALAVLSRDNSSWPATSREHVLIQHMPKTGGTSFRTMVFQEAARHGQTVQTHYGISHEPGPRFDPAHPAQVIMGHSVNFHMLQPVASGHSVRYVTMVRSPLAWGLSLFLHFHPRIETQLDEKVVAFFEGLITQCEGLVRNHSLGTGCHKHNQLYAWHSGGPDGGATAATSPGKCERHVSFFTHSSRLLLVNERYEESMWLLCEMLGWGRAPRLVHLNGRQEAIYDQRVSVRTMSRIDAILAESCLPDIYAAARERFAHVYRLARGYCANQQPCDLATSQFGLSLWAPLQGR